MRFFRFHLRQSRWLLQGISLLVLFATMASPSEASEADARAMLREALATIHHVREAQGDGWWADTLIPLRIAGTMRIQGMRAEALEAIAACRAHNARLNRGALRDEISAELGRLLVYLGEPDRAFSLARESTFRNYDLVAVYMIALAAREMEDGPTLERAIREALAREQPSAQWGDDIWLRGLARLALQMDRQDLAGELITAIQDPFWKSAALSDLGTLEAAHSCPDPYVRVLACARLGALEPTLAAAAELKDDRERDAALRIAVRRLAETGKNGLATRAAAEIRDPSTRFLATTGLVTAETFEEQLVSL